MIIDDISRDDVITVLEHVQATCACNDDFCRSCPYFGMMEDCLLALIPERWKLDKIGGNVE